MDKRNELLARVYIVMMFFVFLSFLALVLIKKTQPMLLMFGVVDAPGAVRTLLTLIAR